MGSLQEVKELRSDPEYHNYIAVGEAMKILGDGLRHYAEQKAKELQDSILKKYGGCCNCTVTPGIKPCRHSCTLGRALTKLHDNKKKSRIPFYQSDSSLWHDRNNGYWEVAKVFMHDLGAKWCDVKDPTTTDLTGLLNFLIFCKHIKVQRNLLKSVRQLRNDWAHPLNYRFSASQKQDAFAAVDNLMNDVELLSCKEVQDCRPGINEVRKGDISVVQARDVEVLRELTRHHEFDRERKEQKKRDEVINMIELISALRGGTQCPSYTSDNSFNENLLDFAYTLILFLTFPVRVLKENVQCRLFSLLTVLALLLACVNDNSVLVFDKGCLRPASTSALGFSEFDFITTLSYKRENFSGRNWFFRELGDIFESTDAPVGVLITGDPGSGKSALMSQLICSPFSSLAIYDNIIGYHVCDYSENEKWNGGRFVRSMVDQIASNIREYSDHVSNKVHIQTELNKHCQHDPTACFFTAVVGPLRELKNKPVKFKYIVIDALDECIEKDGETSAILDILHYKLSYFPHWLKVIMSSQNGTTVTSKVPRTVRRMAIEANDDRNTEDIRSYISRYLRQKYSFISKLYKAISPFEDSMNKITDELTERAEGNFLFVKTILKSNLEGDSVTINFSSFPNSLDDMYYQLFRRYFAKKDFGSYEILFEILLAGGSLQKTEFFGILERKNQDMTMDDLTERVTPLLHFGEDETVSIYHQSFAEWLVNKNNRVKGFSVQKKRGHEHISSFLLDRLKNDSNITFGELLRLSMHVINSGGPRDYQKEYLNLVNVSKILNPQNAKCILHELVQRENASSLLEVFLSNISSVDIPDLEGKTPAFFAASTGFVDNIKPFLDKQTCANCILNDMCTSDEVKFVIQMKGYEYLSTMHIATYNGHTEMVHTLLKHNASFMHFNEYVPRLLHVAAERGHLDLVKLLHENGDKADVISLHHAAARNHSQVVKYLLESAGVKDECFPCKRRNMFNSCTNSSFYDLHNMFCETALHVAVSKRNIDIIKLLLQFGNSALECKHHSGKTPLMDAVERNDTEIAELLLKNGANVEEKCGEKASLSLGDTVRYFYGKKFLYTFYREKTSCPCGNKALHLCAKYGLWHMAKYLINSWNASVLDKNCNGESVWKIANASYNEEFIYHVNKMLLNLDDRPASAQLGMPKYQRRTFKKLLRKFLMRTKPYQSSFQCDSTFEGMSPLHIAALMGVDMLNRVYKKAHEIAPSLPLNCTNKHWITPRYLAQFYDNVNALTGESRSNKNSRQGNEYTKDMLQYPDREAEFHMIYNYFYHSPSAETNVLAYKSLPRHPHYDVTNCPGFYDLLPESKDLRVKSYCSPIQETHDEYQDPAKAALRKMQYCRPNEISFCLCISDIEFRMLQEQYAKDCLCPAFMWELQRWFTSLPKHNRRINQFIAERMGWRDLGNGEYKKRWPVYFLYKKIKNEYPSYKYLEILDEGFKTIDEVNDEY